MTDKATLRRLARLLTPATSDESRRVASRLHPEGVIGRVRSGCVYMAMPGELDVSAVTGLRPSVEWYTTRTVDRSTLSVHPIDSEYELHPFGYEQPVAGSPEVDPTVIDVWVVPGVAFDADGHRLGHGMGYYDRLLERARPGSRFIGVTTERRLFPSIPHGAHDVPMEVVVTEERVLRP